ncbi:uncharacterized protein PAE49_016096 isoform 2-T2 [Odontesthes bonariensis]|uniref:uncharacterized protein LOC142398399 isoform X2 n=1 Tax=Odontesthes bonariensis TaxID=219752 RepID=UPI003F58995C
MSRLQCSARSSAVVQKQPVVEVTSANAEDHKPCEKVERKKATGKPHPPTYAQSCSVQVSRQKTETSGDALITETHAVKDFVGIAVRIDEQGEPREELGMKVPRNLQPPDSTVTGAATRAVELLPKPKRNGQEEQTKEEDAVDEDLKAPVELMMKFLRALMDKEFEVASKLCQMILIYEPDNPEASEFLPLIQRKLLEEQESEQSGEEAEDEEEDDDSESDEKSSCTSNSSSSSCSSSSSDDDDDDKEDDDDDDDDGDGEKHMSRHKPCPPSHISP